MNNAKKSNLNFLIGAALALAAMDSAAAEQNGRGNAALELLKKDIPTGTRVRIGSDDYSGRTGTVESHELNLIEIPMVVVKLDGAADSDYKPAFYPVEVTGLTKAATA